MSVVEERVRDLEIAGARVSVEVEHLKSAVAEAAQTVKDHVAADGKTHGAMRSENRRFLVLILVLVLAAVVGQFFK